MHIWKHQVSSDLLLRSTFIIKSIVSDRTKKLVRSYSKVIENTICVILCHQLQLRCGTIDQNIIYKIFAAKIFQVYSCVSTPPINLFISTYLSIYLSIYISNYLIYIYIYIYINQDFCYWTSLKEFLKKILLLSVICWRCCFHARRKYQEIQIIDENSKYWRIKLMYMY